MQYLTDGHEKYIWYTLTGKEELFDLSSDPTELHNLAPDPSAKSTLEKWRKRLIEELSKRKENGLADRKQLIPGKELPAVRPELLK